MDPLYGLKPSRWPFLLWTLTVRITILLALALVASIALPWDLIVWSAFTVLAFGSILFRSARYRKERYEFYPDRMIVRSGGLFSDSKTELVYSRVTHVTRTLPWLEHLIFGTGTISVQSAGSSGSEATLRSIDDSERMYRYVEELLKSNGFRLRKDELLVSAKPHPLAVALATARTLLTAVFVLFWLLVDVGLSVISSTISAYSMIVLPFLILIFIGVIAVGILRYLHLSRREYFVHSDTITYEEGFLTKRYSFLPAENLADSSTTQTWVDRIFDLYDVKVSVQGAGSEIRFSNLREGQKVDAAIDYIIDHNNAPVQPKRAAANPQASKRAVEASASGTYRPVPKRGLLPLLFWAPLLIFPPMYIIVVAGYLIRTFTETYEIRSGRVIYSKRFLSTKRVEFTADKVTQVEFVKDILDRFTDTVTVKIKSIGSSDNITLFAIPDTPKVRQSVLSVDNISEGEPSQLYDSSFTLWGALVRHAALVWVLVIVALMLIVIPEGLGWLAIVAVPLLALALATILFFESRRYANARLSLHDGYARYVFGWLRKTIHYARFDSLKDVSTHRYWRSTAGDVTINIAGEESVQSGQQQSQRSQSFTAAYMADSFGVHNSLLSSLGADEQPQLLLSARPQARNAGFLLVLIVPLIILLPFVLWSYSRRAYRVFSDRIEHERGVLGRRKKTILYGMIDHVRTGQGFINKLFSNGRVSVHTTGSSSVEMVMGPFKEYSRVGEAIEQQYR